MISDHKPSRKKASASPQGTAHKARGGTVLGIFIGLVVGILIALAVVWYMNRTPAPFLNKTQSAPENGNSNGNGNKNTATAPQNTNNANGASLPSKPGETVQEKRFQFYDILPGKSDPKPDTKNDAKADIKTTEAPSKAEEKAGSAMSLQAGSFQNMKDAENLKATLTLMGIEPHIQTIQIAERTWYRVRVGPFSSFEEQNRVKNEMAKSGIKATVVKANE